MLRITQDLYEVKLSAGKAIVAALKGNWNGHCGVCRCPAHDDQNPSLSVRQDGDRLLVHCFSGCDQRAVVDALDRLGLWWPHRRKGSVPSSPGIDIAAERQRRAECGHSTALRIWREAKPVTNRLGERYLLNRGAAERNTLLPHTLRFHTRLWHSESKRSWRALVARVDTVNGQFTGIHRIYLSPNGDKAPVVPVKVAIGPIAGGAIHLNEPADELIVADALEDGLALMTDTPECPVWCAPSDPFLAQLVVPERVRRVLIFEDNDLPAVGPPMPCIGASRLGGRR